MPFYRCTGTAEPRIIVEQVAPNSFVLRRGFRYKAPFRDEPYEVPAGEETDLASVPWPLWWLIASYGRHTKAALLHDALIDPSDRIRPEDRVPRREADRVFFHALKESGFGEPRDRRRTSWLRRWVMYAAVVIPGTMRRETPVSFVVFLAHLGLFVVLSACFLLDRWFEGAWPLFEVVIPLVDVEVFDSRTDLLVLGVTGFAWALHNRVDTRLGLGLWPAAIFAVLFALPFTLVLAVPWLAFAAGDFLYNLVVSMIQRKWQGGPIVTPTRTPGEL